VGSKGGLRGWEAMPEAIGGVFKWIVWTV